MIQQSFYCPQLDIDPITRRIVAACVVSERSLPYNSQLLETPEKSFDFWNNIVAKEPDHDPSKECVIVVAVDARLHPFVWNVVSIGTVNEASAHPREILRPVIAAGAYGFVLMHNHPSGDPSPSRADESITRRLSEASKLLQVTMMDHVVIGKPCPGRTPYFSFREAGMIA